MFQIMHNTFKQLFKKSIRAVVTSAELFQKFNIAVYQLVNVDIGNISR